MAQKVEKRLFLCDVMQIGMIYYIIFLLKNGKNRLVYLY